MSEYQKRWIGIDLDGCLAFYEGWQGIEHVGKPIPLMVERVKSIIKEGEFDVKIFTARVHHIDHVRKQGASFQRQKEAEREVKEPIEKWCLEHIGMVLDITNVKDFAMELLYDDRAITVEFNTGKIK